MKFLILLSTILSLIVFTKSELSSPNLNSLLNSKKYNKGANKKIINKRVFKNDHNDVSITASSAISAPSNKNESKQLWYMNFLPIYPNELAKFFSLSMMMVIILL